MDKVLIQKQKKFLGLFFGFWALLFFNSWIFAVMFDVLGLYDPWEGKEYFMTLSFWILMTDVPD